MNKELFKDIALQAGGSHYPESGGALLNCFADLLIKEVIATVEKTPIAGARTTYDADIVACTIANTIETIKKRFEV
jgi:hypothetical protein